MDDWRDHARRGEWRAIEFYRLSDAERLELLELLERVVPTRSRGDGIETFEGFIPPREARSEAEYEAALLAQSLERCIETEAQGADYFRPFTKPVELAIATLRDHGIKFEGWRRTFLYWHPNRYGWVQLDGKTGAAIRAKREKLFWQTIDCPKNETHAAMLRLIAWERLYPWRVCESLALLFKRDAFEPSTPLWHALRIFDWYEGFQGIFANTRSARYSTRHDRIFDQLHVAECGVEIGRSYEALIKKPIEPHALRGFKSLQSAHRGADMRRGKIECQTRQVLATMKPLIASGLTISNAARLTAKRGIGKSKEANRALWHRHHRKKL